VFVTVTCRWTELHPRLLGVPELSRAIAEYWVSALRLLDNAVAMRTCNPTEGKLAYLSFLNMSCLLCTVYCLYIFSAKIKLFCCILKTSAVVFVCVLYSLTFYAALVCNKPLTMMVIVSSVVI